MNRLDQYTKAIVAALVAAFGLYQVVRPDGVTPDEWGDIAATAVATLLLTWGVPNAEKPYDPQHLEH